MVMRDGLGHRDPSPPLLYLFLAGFEHEDHRVFREALVVPMNPDARSKRVVEPELIAVRRLDLAPEGQTDRVGARGGPIGATVQPQRVGACLHRVGPPPVPWTRSELTVSE